MLGCVFTRMPVAESYLLQKVKKDAKRCVISRMLELDIRLDTANIRYTVYSADTPQPSTGPPRLESSVCIEKKTDWSIVPWLCEICYVFVLFRQHKGFVRPVFTNNTDKAKGKTVRALVTNVVDSW